MKSYITTLLLCLTFYFQLTKLAYASPSLDKTLYQRPREVPFRPLKGIHLEQREKLIELGRLLFFDPRFSKNGLISCATCHNPSFHWTDGLAVSIEGASRRSMSLYNLAWDGRYTWLGSAGSMMSQAILALSAPLGMGVNMPKFAEKVASIPAYQKLLRQGFPQQEKLGKPFAVPHIMLAFEYFVATIVSPKAPFDSWVEGDEHAITDSQKRGFAIFTGKAGCSSCHAGWRFSDSSIYDIGLLMTEEEAKQPFFKAVGLRQIADRPPYMHNGQFKTLQEVVEFYNRGGDAQRPMKSKLIKPLQLSEKEKHDLISFLESLSGKQQPVTFPQLPR